MNGKIVKDKLKRSGIPLSEIASRLGYDNDQRLHSQLKSNDVKTGILEQICSALGVNMSFFYPNEDGKNAIASGDSSVAVAHNTGSISAAGSDTAALKERITMLEKLLDERERLLDEKERLIKVYESMMNKSSLTTLNSR